MIKTKKSGCAFILMLFLALTLLIFMLIPPISAGATYDAGYPAPATPTAWGYPAPVTPTADWCEDARLLDLRVPWCPVIGEAVSTVASQPEPTETPAAIVKVGGRQKGREK